MEQTVLFIIRYNLLASRMEKESFQPILASFSMSIPSENVGKPLVFDVSRGCRNETLG